MSFLLRPPGGSASVVCFALLIFCRLMCPDLASAQGTSRSSKTALENLFVVTEVVSDASPFWFKYVLDLSPSPEGTSARWIRIAPFGNACPGVTVKAMSATVRKSLAELVTPDLCSLSVSRVDKAISDVTRKTSILDTASFGIVAKCGAETKVFRLPLGDLVDMDRLQRNSRDSASLYDLYYRLVREGFQDRSFYKNSDEVDRRLQQSGSTFVDDLRSGKYDRGLSRGYLSGKRLQDFLSDYRGVRHDADYIEAWFQLDNATKDSLTQYVEPVYPPLAIAARVKGEVQLDIELDEVGQVQNVRASGNRLLTESASVAAKQWKFKPETRFSGKVQAKLEYRLGGRCE